MVTTSLSPLKPNFRTNRLLQGLLVGFLAVWVWGAIRPLYPHDWMIENILLVLCVAGLAATYRRFPLSDVSYILITLFLALHTVGAHYTYAEVPFGYWLKETFAFQRNHFDRIVHFSFGFLLAYPIREVFLRVVKTKGFWTYYLPLDVTMAFSCLYELVEMAVCVIVSPGLGDAYLGTQGDIWDAQKDMAMATLGAFLAMTVTALLHSIFFKGIPARPASDNA